MRLTELNPKYINGNDDLEITGVEFDCPCRSGNCIRLYIPFNRWHKTGDSFENLTLTPSIQRLDNCKWHGFVTDGNIVNA